MKHTNNYIMKAQTSPIETGIQRIYHAPSIEKIVLDNEISLILESAPPIGPGETKNNTIPEYLNKNPYYV